jgi:archaellum component FlaG (FlaF/FlaG flagellin family)
MKKAIKYILMGFGVIMIIGIIAAALSSNKPTVSSSSSKGEKSETKTSKNDLEILQETSESQVLGSDTVVTVHVQVKNNTDELKQYVQASATFYDADGKIVGTGMGNTTNLSAGAKRTIDVQGMNVSNGHHYELEVHDHPF